MRPVKRTTNRVVWVNWGPWWNFQPNRHWSLQQQQTTKMWTKKCEQKNVNKKREITQGKKQRKTGTDQWQELPRPNTWRWSTLCWQNHPSNVYWMWNAIREAGQKAIELIVKCSTWDKDATKNKKKLIKKNNFVIRCAPTTHKKNTPSYHSFKMSPAALLPGSDMYNPTAMAGPKAMERVIVTRTTGETFQFKKPSITYWPANVPVMVEAVWLMWRETTNTKQWKKNNEKKIMKRKQWKKSGPKAASGSAILGAGNYTVGQGLHIKQNT